MYKRLKKALGKRFAIIAISFLLYIFTIIAAGTILFALQKIIC